MIKKFIKPPWPHFASVGFTAVWLSGRAGLPPLPRNGREDEEKRLEKSFGRRQLQPTSTTGGCRSVKLLLLDDGLLDMAWQCAPHSLPGY